MYDYPAVKDFKVYILGWFYVIAKWEKPGASVSSPDVQYRMFYM